MVSVALTVIYTFFFSLQCSQRRNVLRIHLYQTAVSKYQKPAYDLKAMFALNVPFNPSSASQLLVNLSLCLSCTAAL